MPHQTQSTFSQQFNAGAARLTEWVTSILLERSLFQNTHIPIDTLLFLINDVIQTLVPEETATLNMAEEIKILGKRILGKVLTPEEEQYEKIPNKILDPTTEIMNGLRYSSMALLGQQLYTSISNAVSDGLWRHIPVIAGYTAAITVGPQAIGHVVNEALRYTTSLNSEQKELIKPWLVMFGRLALRLVPKVHATEAGVHYHYPSIEGHTQTFSVGQTVTMHGEGVTVESAGSVQTPEGVFAASHQFQLHRVTRVSTESVHIQILNENGEKIPLRFTLTQGQFGPEIQVTSTNPDIATHWSKYFKGSVTQNHAITLPVATDTTTATATCKTVTRLQPLHPEVLHLTACAPIDRALQSVQDFSAIFAAHTIGGLPVSMTLMFLAALHKIPVAVTAAPTPHNNIRDDFYINYFQKTIYIASQQTQYQTYQDSKQNNYFANVANLFRSMYDPAAAISSMYSGLAQEELARLGVEAQSWGDDCISSYQKISNTYQRFQSAYFNEVDQISIPKWLSYAYPQIESAKVILQHPGMAFNAGFAALTLIQPEFLPGWLDRGDAAATLLAELSPSLDAASKDHNMGLDDVRRMTNAFTCNIMSASECEEHLTMQALWNEATDAINPNAYSALQKSLAYANKQLEAIRATIQQQAYKKSQAQEYSNAIQGISNTFHFAAIFAQLTGDSRAATKIQAIGQVSIHIVNALQAIAGSSKWFGSAIMGISDIEKAIAPFFTVADAVFSVLSLFGGGGESADDAILHNQKIIMQQLQDISREIVGLSKEVFGLSKEMRQGFEGVYTNFHQVFKNLEVIFARLIQGEEITQEVGQQLQTSILQLRFQIDYSVEDVLRQKYTQDAARLPLIVRSNISVDNPVVIKETRRIARSSFAHAVTDATTLEARRGETLMIGINTAGSTQSAMEEAEADNLAKHPPEEYIGYYQAVAQPYLSNPLPNYANGIMWLRGANTYINNLAVVGPKALPFAKQELDGIMQTGFNLLQFPRELVKSKRFLTMLFNQYNGAKDLWGQNAGGIIQQAWQTYAATDPGFQTNFVKPLQQKLATLAQEVEDWGTWNVPLTTYFEAYGSSSTFDSLLKTYAYLLVPQQSYNYFSNIAQSVNNFLAVVEEACADIFNPATLATLRFPCIAFNTDTPVIVPIDITDAVSVPQEIILGYILGIVEDISFTYSMRAQSASPLVQVTGTYVLLSGESVTFFSGSFTNDQLPYGNADILTGHPFTEPKEGPISFNWRVPLCSDLNIDTCFATSDLSDCPFPISPLFTTRWGTRTSPFEMTCKSTVNNPFEWEWVLPPLFSFLFFNFHAFSGIVSPQVILSQAQTFDFLASSEYAKTIYLQLSVALYNTIFIKTWYGIYQAPIPNTATWSITDQTTLAAKINTVLTTISQEFFQTILENNDSPEYAAFTQGLEAINAAYNRLYGYTHFIYPTTMQGAHSANTSTLCVPSNPWSANGTHFNISNGVSFQANPGTTPSVITSNYAIMLKNHDLTIEWAPLDNSSATIGLMLGNKTIISFNVNASLPTPSYTTQIRSLDHIKYLITTTDQTGCVIRRSVNITQPSALISAFVNNTASTTQGIKIVNASRIQRTTNLSTSAVFWDTVNAQNVTLFTPTEMTFYGVNSSSPWRWTKLITNKTIGVMNTHTYVAWKANPGQSTIQNLYNMTVGFDFGLQKAVAEFAFGNKCCLPDIWYYTRFTVTPQHITVITCAHDFIDRGGEPLFNCSQPNTEVSDFSQLAVRISDNDAPSGVSSVSLRSVDVVGFNASILPEPMQVGRWTATNSSRSLLPSPEGLTVFGNNDYPQGSILRLSESVAWRHKELWLKWRVDGQGSVSLQLANNAILLTPTSQQSGQWIYTRVVVFNAYALIYTSTNNYDLNCGAANIVLQNVSSTPQTGGLSCTILPNAGQLASLTLSECVVQNAANTIFNQMFQNGGLMNREALIRAALNSTDPQDLTRILRKLSQDVAQLEELFLAMTDFSRYPQDIDPRIAMTVERIQAAQAAVAGSTLNLTASSQRFFKDITATHTRSPSHSLQHKMRLTHTSTAAHTRSASYIPKVEHTHTSTGEVVQSAQEELQEIHSMLRSLQAQSEKQEYFSHTWLPMLLSITTGGALLIVYLIKINRQLQRDQALLLKHHQSKDLAIPLLDHSGINNHPSFGYGTE